MTSTTGPPDVPLLTTNNGVAIAQIGLGTGQVNGDDVVVSVSEATRVGYRLIDTAKAYQNETDVGRAIRACGVGRDELFISTKLHRADHGYDATLRGFDGSLERLGLEVIDCFLIHFPLPGKDKYVETWKAFERLQLDGRVRVIGVSNFALPHLRRLLDECDVVPAINQIELHPGFPQAELRAFHQEHGILTEAWSPIGHGQGVLDHGVIAGIAVDHRRLPAQVVLRWQVQLGNLAIPGSTNPNHIRANLDVFDFVLGEEEMEAITGVGSDDRLGPDPETFNPPETGRPRGSGPSGGREMKLATEIRWQDHRFRLPLARIALTEELGYDAVFTSEGWGSDALTPLGYLASVTKRLKLGTSVAQVTARSPAAVAMAMQTLDAMTGAGG